MRYSKRIYLFKIFQCQIKSKALSILRRVKKELYKTCKKRTKKSIMLITDITLSLSLTLIARLITFDMDIDLNDWTMQDEKPAHTAPVINTPLALSTLITTHSESYMYISLGARMSSILRIIRTSWVANKICCFLAVRVSITCWTFMSGGKK